jgi:hypothetical protein
VRWLEHKEDQDGDLMPHRVATGIVVRPEGAEAKFIPEDFISKSAVAAFAAEGETAK